MKLLRAVVFVFCLIAASSFADIVERKPLLEELEVLANRGDWAEVVLRLPDFLPSQRGERWEALVERAALGHLSTLASEGMSGSETVAAELLRTFPTLRRSKTFMSQRSALGIEGFEACYAAVPDGDDCSERLFSFAKDDPQNLDFILKAAELAHRNQGGGAGIPFVELAVHGPNRAVGCQRPETRAILLAGLSLPAGSARDGAVQLTAKRCWKWVGKELATSAGAPQASPHLVDSACVVFRSVGALMPRNGPCARVPSSKPR